MDKRRLFFFFLADLLAILLLIYILNMVGVIDYKAWLKKNVPFLAEEQVRAEDPLLLEKMELEKRWKLLQTKEQEIKKQWEKLELEKEKISNEMRKIAEEKLKVQQAFSNIEAMKRQESDYSKQVQTVAQRLLNMPIQDAVKILNKLDDEFVIDIFKEMDRIAEDQGIMSSVPEYLRRMNEDKAARIQRKMLSKGLELR